MSPLTILSALLLSGWMTLHPGHSTRVELQVNAEQRTLELAMRIDHADLELALRKRQGVPVVIERLEDDEAANQIGDYLRETLRLNDAAIRPDRFRWVGWERRRLSSWVYVEIDLADGGQSLPEAVTLEIKTLLEVEPELNHVVTQRRGNQTLSVVLDRTKPRVRLRTTSSVEAALPEPPRS